MMTTIRRYRIPALFFFFLFLIAAPSPPPLFFKKTSLYPIYLYVKLSIAWQFAR